MTVNMHKIDTGDVHPVRQPFIKEPLPHKDSVDEQLAEGCIEPSVSECSRVFCSPTSTDSYGNSITWILLSFGKTN